MTPPRLHMHRYCGVLASNAALREAVTASAEATLLLLEQARSPLQLAFGFDQAPATDDWPEMDQTAG